MQDKKNDTKIIIRGLETTDWEDIAAIFLAPKCQFNTLQIPYQSREQMKKRTEQGAQEGHSLVAVIESKKKAVGLIGLEIYQGRRSHVGYLGMAVHDQYQNLGIGSQLLAAMLDLSENWLNLQRLELTVYCDNEVAIALYQKYGFVIEGTLKKYAYRAGEYVDAYAMAKVR